jgi:plasmid maintenance system antidote protein VapI
MNAKFIENQVPFIATPPGRIIQRSLDSFAISAEEFALQNNLEPRAFTDMVKGNEPLSLEMALALEKAWNVPVSVWLKLEQDYKNHPKRLGGARMGAGRKLTGVQSRQVRVSAQPEEMQLIQNWLKAQSSAASSLAGLILREIKQPKRT